MYEVKRAASNGTVKTVSTHQTRSEAVHTAQRTEGMVMVANATGRPVWSNLRRSF